MNTYAWVRVSITLDAIGCADECEWLDISHAHGYRCFLFGIDSGRQLPRVLTQRRNPPGPLRCADCIAATGHTHTYEKDPKP